MEPAFLEPTSTAHRQCEALREFVVEGLAAAEVPGRFGETPGSFRAWCSQLRTDPRRGFFLPDRSHARRAVAAERKSSRLCDPVIGLR